VLVDRSGGKSAAAQAQAAARDGEVVDKTPIVDEDAEDGQAGDDFGGFDDEEDEQFMLRAKRNAMRRRGLDPHALNKGQAKKADGSKASSKEATEEASEDNKEDKKEDKKQKKESKKDSPKESKKESKESPKDSKKASKKGPKKVSSK
jgi:ribosomal RNA methyltransferase Nop2